MDLCRSLLAGNALVSSQWVRLGELVFIDPGSPGEPAATNKSNVVPEGRTTLLQ